jgi:MFS superfamily sulfate permease-like transporter
MAQVPAFTGMPEGFWAATTVCALATPDDAVLVLTLWATGVVLFRDRRCFVPPRWTRYAVVALLRIAVQATVEWTGYPY